VAGAKRKGGQRSSVTIEEDYRPSVGTGRFSDRIAISPYATGDPQSEAMKESFVRRKPRVQRTTARTNRRRAGTRT